MRLPLRHQTTTLPPPTSVSHLRQTTRLLQVTFRSKHPTAVRGRPRRALFPHYLKRQHCLLSQKHATSHLDHTQNQQHNMGRVKQTAQRSQFALEEEQQVENAPTEIHVKTEMEDVEVDPYKEQGADIDMDKNLSTEVDAQSDSPEDDDALDDDFEDDAGGDSDYEEYSATTRSRRSRPKASSTTAKRSQTLRRPSNSTMSGSRKSRANSATQIPRALRKAHRDVERRPLPKGQPPPEGDRALRCLPYRTLNRAPKRELIRWNDDTYLHTLLAMAWVLEVRETEIPWDEIAAVVHPGATGEAFKQALAKLRTKRLKDDLSVPPLRPGKEKTRRQCEGELDQLMSVAKMARDKTIGRNANLLDDENGDDKVARSMTPSHSVHDDDGMSSASTAMSTVTLQAVAGKVSDLRERPSRAVARLQNKTNGLDTAMDVPGVDDARPSRSSLEMFSARHRASSRTNHGRPGSEAAQVAKQHEPTTPPAQNLSTPPSRLRTPSQCPPAPRSSSHSRKRSGDILGAPMTSPTPKRRPSDTRNPRHPSLSQIPEYDPYYMSPSYGTPNTYGHSRHNSDGQGSLGGGGMMLPPLGYGSVNPLMQQAFMQNIMQSFIPGAGMHQSPFVPPSWPVGPFQQQDPLHQRSGPLPAHINPMVLHNITGRDFAPSRTDNVDSTSAASQRSQPGGSGGRAGRSFFELDEDNDLTNTEMPFATSVDFFNSNRENSNGPPMENAQVDQSVTDKAGSPFQNLNLNLGRFSEEPKPDPDSQDRSSFSQSTQDSFGSTIQDSKVTSSQPRAGPSTGENHEMGD